MLLGTVYGDVKRDGSNLRIGVMLFFYEMFGFSYKLKCRSKDGGNTIIPHEPIYTNGLKWIIFLRNAATGTKSNLHPSRVLLPRARLPRTFSRALYITQANLNLACKQAPYPGGGATLDIFG